MTTAILARNTQRALMLTAAFVLVALGGVSGARPAQAAPASSAKTIKASDYDPDVANSPLPDLAVTVSQTTDLIQQGLTVSWTGAKQSTVPNQQTGGQNFVQIMQCWGDEPGSNGTRPDRTTCQYGGLNLPGDMRWSNRSPDAVIAPEDTQYTAAGTGYFNPTTTAIPFRSATGVTVASVVDGKKVPNAPDLDTNQFFTLYTTNEVSWAGSGADGSGSVSFELQTAQESPGLGCGAAVTAADGTVTGSPCWLVVLPRGTADPSLTSITQPGLFWETWKHHVAIKLGFRPGGVRCAIGAAERQLSGSELILGAVSQWQPKLCNNTGGAVYSLLTGNESDAALAANGTATAPLALTSRALSVDGVTDSLEYAPVALTGVSVAFAIDRKSRVIGAPVPAAEQAKERQAFTSLKITPRLLAKLLTASYTDALPIGADMSHVSKIRNITQDPDFLAINDPEWSYMNITGPGVGDALVPLGRSDAAVAVWSYILADPAAAAWMNGEADNVRPGDSGNSGMKVNPYYSTNATVNPTGTALALPAQDFPKADPIEFKGTPNNLYADNINLVTWRPFTSSLQQGAYRVLTGNAQELGGWDPNSEPPKYTTGTRALVGLQSVIGLTDTSAASQYQVIQASLLNPAGKYVTPTSDALTAAAAAMTVDAKQKQVVGFDPTSSAAKAAAAAYPLALPVYAAVNPSMTDATVRSDYANFISYASSNGQTVGTGDGQLPDGFAPIPTAWRTQAAASAAIIKSGPQPSASPTASATTATTATTTAAATAATAAAGQTAAGAAAAASTGSATDPAAAGATAPALSAGKTSDDPSVPAMAAVVPVSAAAALAAALAIPPLTRRKRL
jgi:hypothetical protein